MSANTAPSSNPPRAEVESAWAAHRAVDPEHLDETRLSRHRHRREWQALLTLGSLIAGVELALLVIGPEKREALKASVHWASHGLLSPIESAIRPGGVAGTVLLFLVSATLLDLYNLWLQRAGTLAEAEGQLLATVRADVPRFQLATPVLVDIPSLVADPQQIANDQRDDYLSIHVLRLHRSQWLRVMAVMLVLLIGMTSGYAAFIRSVPDLALGAGSLVLGVWGIRSILVPSSISYVTVVDMALGLVITFLLTTLSVRVLLYLFERNGIRLGKRPPNARTSPAGHGSA